MPADPHIPQPSSRTPREAPKKAAWFPWTSILLVSGLMLGVYAVLEYPREIGRWHLAAANEFWTEAEIAALPGGDPVREAENRAQAFAKLEQALSWSPGDWRTLLRRARWNSEIGKHESALADCNQVMNQIEKGSLLGMRMDIYQQLGRHAEAVKDANQLDANSLISGKPPRGEALNNLAYAKALGKIDLPKALQQADESVRSALEEIEQNKMDDEAQGFLTRSFEAFFGVDHRARDAAAQEQLCLRHDTRGFVHYQLGHYVEALSDLNAAADGYTALLDERDISLQKLKRAYPDPRSLELEVYKKKRAAAIVLYHRSLAHEKLGHSFPAANDWNRARKLLGREPDEKLF